MSERAVDLREYNKLIELLEKHDIPFRRDVVMDSPFGKIYQIIYCPNGERRSDVVIGFGTYGAEDGLLEQMGLLSNECLGDDVQGWLDAKTVFDRWAEDFGFFVKGMEV